MAKGAYIGVGSKARKIKKIYFGVGSVAKKVRKAYIGVNGVAKLWWSAGYKLVKQGVYSPGPSGNQTCWNNNYAIFIVDGSSGAEGGQSVNSSFTVTSLPSNAYPNRALSGMTGGQIGNYALLWSGDYTSDGGDSFDHNNTAYYWNSSLTMGSISSAANYNYGSKCCNIGNYMLLVGGNNVTGQSTTRYKHVRAINASLTVNKSLSDVSTGGSYIGGANSQYALFVGGSDTSRKVIYNTSLQVQSLSITGPFSSINYHDITGNEKYIMIAGGTTNTANYLDTVNAYDLSMTRYIPSVLNIGVHSSDAISLDKLSAFVGGGCSGTPGRNLGVNVYDIELTKTMPDDLVWGYGNTYNNATARLNDYIMQKNLESAGTTILNVYRLDS